MLGLGLGVQSSAISTPAVAPGSFDFPVGFSWDRTRFDMSISKTAGMHRCDLVPRDLVDTGIWSGAAFHVDRQTGNDSNTGLGAVDGDFTNAKRSIYSAFSAGNATGAPYRVLVKAGEYTESAFTKNGKIEPNQPVAIIGWGGDVHYRTGPFSINWSDAGGSYSASVSAAKRVFRTDVLDAHGHYSELTMVADVPTCQATINSWTLDGSVVHVNIDQAPGQKSIAVMRSFHGARFMAHTSDLYLENIHCEGGITGALHLDPESHRNVVGVNCSFRYPAPSNPAASPDAVRIRRIDGLAAFFDCDASMGGKDGWSFHEDGPTGLHVLLQNCTGFCNGIDPATSCNGFTTHDGVRAIVLGGHFGHSRNGTEVHCIQTTQTWMLGSRATARDIDGTSVAFKCSNQASMWLQDTIADADASSVNYAIEANAGTVYLRDHTDVSGTHATSVGGVIGAF